MLVTLYVQLALALSTVFSNHESASVFSTSHNPTNNKPNAAVSQRTPRGQPGSESLAAEREWRQASK